MPVWRCGVVAMSSIEEPSSLCCRFEWQCENQQRYRKLSQKRRGLTEGSWKRRLLRSFSLSLTILRQLAGTLGPLEIASIFPIMKEKFKELWNGFKMLSMVVDNHDQSQISMSDCDLRHKMLLIARVLNKTLKQRVAC
jgi:hypothetical protein